MLKAEKDVARLMYMSCGDLDAVLEATQLPEKELKFLAKKEGWKAMFQTLKGKIDSVLKESLKRRMEKYRDKHLNFVLDTLDENQEVIENMVPSTDKEAAVTPERKINLLDRHDQIARRTLGLDKEKEIDPVQEAFKYLVASQRLKIVEVESETIEVGQEDSEALHHKSHNGSAIIPLPEGSDASTGILGAFNGAINGQAKTNDEVVNDTIAEDVEIDSAKKKEIYFKDIPDNLFS